MTKSVNADMIVKNNGRVCPRDVVALFVFLKKNI
jgi:hypothetical protein